MFSGDNQSLKQARDAGGPSLCLQGVDVGLNTKINMK